MQYNYINSKEVVLEVIDNFNIKSFDFLGRVPTWIINCLNDLKVHQTYVTKFAEIPFNNFRCKLPDGCKRLNGLKINGHRAEYRNTTFDGYIDSTIETHNVYTEGRETSEVDKPVIEVVTPYTPSNIPTFDSGIYSPDGKTYASDFLSPTSITDIVYSYNMDNGWLRFDLEQGVALISYAGLPLEFDLDSRLYYPLIPDIESLKTSIRWYIMRILLYHGYSHPLFNLKENNPHTNPGLAYDNLKRRVKVDCNSMNLDRRKNFSNIMTSLIHEQDNSMNYGTYKKA